MSVCDSSVARGTSRNMMYLQVESSVMILHRLSVFNL